MGYESITNPVFSYNYLCGRWSAWVDDLDEEGPVGKGDTKQEAVDDLCDRLDLPYSVVAA